jgi:hypothetical protein
MKRGSSVFALLLVLLTGARWSTTHSSNTAGTGPDAAAVRELTPRETTHEDSSCEAFADLSSKPDPEGKGQITALVQRYVEGSSHTGQLAPDSLPKDIRFMMVTVPDPLHTHLNLQFDRTIEALQQGLQDEKYTYDSSWLPWKKQASEYGGLSDQKLAEDETTRREKCPGLILFRSNMMPSAVDRKPYEHGMFAFVVAENPTSGLTQSQWSNALAWIDKYSNKNRTDKALRILGPTFSGSMPSFVRSLEAIRPDKSSFTSVLLYSGRIRGCGSWLWLKKQLNRSANELPVRTSDFDENDAIEIDRFYRFVTDRGHALSEVAVLSEDETAYGGLPDTPAPANPSSINDAPCEPIYPHENRPLHLYYPRDISAVRSAYQEQSIFSTGSGGASNTPHTVLQQQSSSSQHNQTDTIEPFSGEGMALTQEAQLYGIVNSLNTHGIRYLILRSTNSLDYLFLARFFHRAYPDAYIVTMGTDMLFGREIDSTEFRGVVALSIFPLLPRGQDWTKQTSELPQHAHRIFGSDIMEGVYLASRFLISDDAVAKQPDLDRDLEHYVHPPKPDIPDYAEPFWDDPSPLQAAPITWLSVIGRDGYWPLAVLKAPFHRLPASNLTSVTKTAPSNGRNLSTGQFSLSSAWKFFCFLAVLAICLHFVACHIGWRHQDMGLFVQFTPHPGKRQLALMALGWAMICSLLLLLLLASAPLYAWLRRVDQIWVWIVGIAAIAGVVAIVLDLGRWPRRRKTKMAVDEDACEVEPRWQPGSGVWIVVSLAIVFIAGVAGLNIFDYFTPNGVITAYRSVHFTSGISPIVSLLFLLGGYYWWFWQSLCGLALLGDGRPVLPDCTVLPPVLARISSAMATNIERFAVPFPSFRAGGQFFYLLPVLLLLLEGCVLQRPWSEGFDSILHSLENRSMSWTLHLLFAIGLYLLMLECIQLLRTWFSLKRLLLALDRLPLRRTFAALQGLSMRSLWTLSGTSSRARYAIFSHQVESLNHLRNELSSFDSRDLGDPDTRQVIDDAFQYGYDFVVKRSVGVDLAMINNQDAHTLRECFSACTEQILGHVLLPSWTNEKSSLNLSEANAEETAKTKLQLSNNPVVKLAEEFVCMVYVGYLQNMIARMRTMVLSIIGIFAAIALSVACYPYSPRPLLALSLMTLLLVIGAVVATVYAGLDRDNTLSHITNTEPGHLGLNFWVRIISFVGVPALGLIVAQFPEVTDFVASWIQPGMNAVK